MPTNLAEICYRKNFLTEVIVRADFVSPFPDFDKKLPTELTEIALRRFPIYEPQQSVEREIQFKIEPGPISTKERTFTEWVFHGKERKKTLRIIPQALMITYTEYERFEDFRDEFLAIFAATCKTFPDARIGRLGLRFINNVNLEDLPATSVMDWSAYIHADLLGLFKFDPMITRMYRVYFTTSNSRMMMRSFVFSLECTILSILRQYAVGYLSSILMLSAKDCLNKTKSNPGLSVFTL